MGKAIRSVRAVGLRRGPARIASLAAALAMALGVAACGGSDEPAYCADRAALEQSLADLADVDVRADGLDALRAQLRQVERDATALVSSARDEFGPEASALRAAIVRLDDSARAALDDPSAQRVSDVAADASDAAAAFGALSDELASRC
jgi:hypothetical protein